MKLKKIFISTLLSSAAVASFAITSTQYYGVNLSGYEFAEAATPGNYPSNSDMT